jgi:carbonic anhydrase
LNNDEKKRFKNMIEMNKKFCSEEVLLKRIFRVINLNMDGGINFAEYLKLRNFNNAYDICLVKEKKINYKNFPVMVHFVYKKL